MLVTSTDNMETAAVHVKALAVLSGAYVPDDLLDEALAERMLLGLVEAANVERRPVTRREIAKRASETLGTRRPRLGRPP